MTTTERSTTVRTTKLIRGSAHQLMERDLRILAWVGRHGIVNADQIGRRFFRQDNGAVSTRQAYRRIRALNEMGLLTRDCTPFWRAPLVHRLTPAGARACESALRPARFVEADIRHSVAVVDLVESLVRAHPDAELRTERELRSERRNNRGDVRHTVGEGRCPDALLIFPGDRQVAIELDLTPKRSVDYERIIDAYQHELFHHVRWYVPPAIVGRLARVIASTNSSNFIDVFGWSAADSSAA